MTRIEKCICSSPTSINVFIFFFKKNRGEEPPLKFIKVTKHLQEFKQNRNKREGQG